MNNNYYLTTQTPQSNNPLQQYIITTPSEPSARRHHTQLQHQQPYISSSSTTRQQQQYYDTTTIIDYKSKTFQLMQLVTQMEIRHKQLEKSTFYLQRQLQIIHKELEEFLSTMRVNNLGEVKEKYCRMQRQLEHVKQSMQKPLIKQQKLTLQYEKILSQYKIILKTQQQKVVKYQMKWKQKERTLIQQVQTLTTQNNKMKENLLTNKQIYEKQSQQVQKALKQEIEKLTKENNSLMQQLHTLREQQLKTKQQKLIMQSQSIETKKDIDLMKTQFRQLIIQKQSLQEKHQKLKKKYKQEIQHFEIIEKEVEEKLIQVEKEITFYREEREVHLQKIARLKDEVKELKQNCDKLEEHEDEFSFGGYYNMETQTEQEEFLEIQQGGITNHGGELMMTNECYQISIKSLLEQNNRLKRTLVLLERTKAGEELPAEAELELKLLKGLMKSTLQQSGGNNSDSNRFIQQQSSQQLQKNPISKLKQHLQIDSIYQYQQTSQSSHIAQMEVYSPKFRHQTILQKQQLGQKEFMMNAKQVESNDMIDEVCQEDGDILAEK